MKKHLHHGRIGRLFSSNIAILVATFICTLIYSTPSPAQRRFQPRVKPTSTYEIGIAAGTYDGEAYTEFSGALNSALMDPWVWRNSLFARSGSGSAVGLDSSARYRFEVAERSAFPMGFYAGPGFRLSSADKMGPFVEAGGMLMSRGFAFGFGIKSIYLMSPGTDKNNKAKANQDTVISILLSAGGGL